MNRRILDGIALAAAFLLTLANTPVAAQVAANGPYYATPSWDQTFPAASRFVVLTNMRSEAVLDRETGLVWTRTPSVDPRTFSAKFTFEQALSICRYYAAGGRWGWRLPSLEEYATLFDATGGLPSGHPFNIEPAVEVFFWTREKLPPPFVNQAYAIAIPPVSFPQTSLAAPSLATDSQFPVLCVRSPTSTPR